jgi:hypothetical protein
MATITVTTLLTNAAIILSDTTYIRWTQNELLAWLNDGQREIALFKPNAFTKNVAVVLVAGTKQSLPSDAISLVDIVRNMGTSGSTPGRAIRTVSREILDAQTPYWHSAAASTEVKQFSYTPLDLKRFYVTPPQPTASQGYVEMVYLAYPTDATSGSTITLDDIYVTALLNYILYRAYGKDSEYAANTALAGSYYQQFMAIIQGKVAAESASNPTQALGPASPNNPGSVK